MEKKAVVRRVVAWALVLAIALSGFLVIRRIKALEALSGDLIYSVSESICGGYRTKVFVDRLDDFLDGGQGISILSSTIPRDLYGAWMNTGRATYRHALNKRLYGLRTRLRYEDYVAELTRDNLYKCRTASCYIGMGFLSMWEVLSGYVKNGKTPQNSQEVRDYVTAVRDKLLELSELMDKYIYENKNHGPFDADEYTAVFLAMCSELYDFSVEFMDTIDVEQEALFFDY